MGIGPLDYYDLLDFYTHRGYRVIACATKQVAYEWAHLAKMERTEVESDLEFIGFIIFENKLKPATAGIVEELEQAGIRQVMCTGDNILTAISVARECSLISSTAHCFVPHIAEGTLAVFENDSTADSGPGDARDPNARLSWHSVDNPLFMLDEKTLTVRRSICLSKRIPKSCSRYHHQQKATSLCHTTCPICAITA